MVNGQWTKLIRWYIARALNVIFLGRGSSRSTGLGEVALHVLLEIEVGEFRIVSNLEKAGKLSIRDDLALILRVLERVGLDVLGEKTSDFRACHFGSFGLAEESTEFR